VEPVSAADGGDLAPVLVVQPIRVEVEETANQPAKRKRGGRMDRSGYEAEQCRQRVRSQREPCDDTEGAAATALQGPEELGVRARVGNAHVAVRRDDLRFQQAGCSGPEFLRVAAKAAT